MKGLLIGMGLAATWLPIAAIAETEGDPRDKIQFELDQLDADGRYTLFQEPRAIAYEFCIPNDRAVIKTVQSIDRTLILFLNRPGQVNCEADELLAVGETRQPNPRAVLIQLARLPQVTRIEPSWDGAL